MGQLGIASDAGQRDRLLALISLLHQWNRRFSLTAVRTLPEMVVRHLLDSAAVAPFLAGQTVLDIGCGPGFPGLPLAVLEPTRQFVLIDGNLKKTRFAQHAAATLAIGNARVLRVRAEQYPHAAQAGTILWRAVADPVTMLHLALPLARPGGRLLALLGQPPGDDRLPADLAGAVRSLGVTELRVPGLQARRHLWQFVKAPGQTTGGAAALTPTH